MQSIKTLGNLKNKTVLMRVDFNVPIIPEKSDFYGKTNRVLDDYRIRKVLPSINFLLKKGAKLVLITHLGKDGKQSLKPVIDHCFNVLKLDKSKISFLDNIRKFPGEIKNETKFAKELSKLGDLYVNEAFSASHREHASIVGLPKFLPSYAGFRFIEEVKNLSLISKKQSQQSQQSGHFLFILGGAKFSTKIPLIKKYLKIADKIFIGGALLNNFLKDQGIEIGKSLYSENDYGIKKILSNKKLASKIILPIDIVASAPGEKKLINRKIGVWENNSWGVKKSEIILDIGKESTKILESYIKKSKLILFNGPLGQYEKKGGDIATRRILRFIASSKACSIIGGGDTVELISAMKLEKKFSFISIGGGATLNFLLNGTLPGIEALKH